MSEADDIKKLYEGLSGLPFPEKTLQNDLRAIRKAHSHQKLHHYQNQPKVKKMKAQAKRRRWEKFEKILDVFAAVAVVLVLIIFIGILVLMLIIKKGLGF